MKIKTSELTGPALDWAVAKIEGKDYTSVSFRLGSMNLDQLQEEASSCGLEFESWWDSATLRGELLRQCEEFSPSTNWAQGGPILEREQMQPTYQRNGKFKGQCGCRKWYIDSSGADMACTQYGPTLLIAAMRCYVASKLGDEVDVPEELT